MGLPQSNASQVVEAMTNGADPIRMILKDQFVLDRWYLSILEPLVLDLSSQFMHKSY